MNTLNPLPPPIVSQADVFVDESARKRLALYDWYGALAYGVILPIVPQPERAQALLLELFGLPNLPLSLDRSPAQAAAIVRLARQKALEAALAAAAGQAPAELPTPTNDTLPKLVFELTFRHGATPAVVAKRLQIKYDDVLKAIRDYIRPFGHLKPSRP